MQNKFADDINSSIETISKVADSEDWKYSPTDKVSRTGKKPDARRDLTRATSDLYNAMKNEAEKNNYDQVLASLARVRGEVLALEMYPKLSNPLEFKNQTFKQICKVLVNVHKTGKRCLSRKFAIDLYILGKAIDKFTKK